MKKYILSILMFCYSLSAVGSSDIHHHEDENSKRFINNNWMPNPSYQQSLRNDSKWKNFVQKNGNWWVQFNETNNKPHRAFGQPIQLNSTTSAEAAALSFLNDHASMYLENNIELRSTGKVPHNNNYFQPNFIQYYNGLEVLWSRATVKITKDYKAVMFGLDVYNDISISTTPEISSQTAISFAASNLANQITKISSAKNLKILPIPNKYNNSYKLVYEIIVESIDQENIPSRYYTLVDANNGEILYRVNKVVFFDDKSRGNGADITVQGTVYPSHPYNPSAIVNLPYITVSTAGGLNYTDQNGFINIVNSTSFPATFELQGPWAMVYEGVTGNTISTLSSTVNPGTNSVLLDPSSNIQQLTAYYHTNVIHDFMKSKLPAFTGLDYPLVVRVNRNDGTCNAFYDGTINFYTTAGGCNALSQVSDVVYHEYGHGISNVYWNDNGLSFSNGAMGEGYSDIWAISITNNPTLGIGLSTTDPNTFVRNYDFPNGANRKIYPQNLVGQVHADGEIIAGAWWSTALNLGSTSQMADLFGDSHVGLANGPDGSEGQVYLDILIDALFADDNDADLTNGTPNAGSIVPAFASHGITLLSTANLAHTPISSSAINTPINISASLTNVQFAWALQGVKGAYKINNSSTWNPILFTNTGGTNYTASIPGQPNGTVLAYYLGIEDINGTLSNVLPSGANGTDPNLPYFIMVGFNKIFTEDFDFNGSIWTEGISGDNATTGIWEQTIPDLTSVNNQTVQTNTQVTPGGVICYVTGANENGSVGGNDVDGGRTTLESPLFNLTGYTNPTIEYYRWYTNDQGSTPGTDYWQVLISEDGTNYINIENTRTADHSWRNNIFRVKDYFPTATQLSVRFVAEDANAGSLVEALMDDLSLYDEQLTGINEKHQITLANAFPNPAKDQLNVSLMMNQSGEFNFIIVDVLGKIQYNKMVNLTSGNQLIEIPTNELSNGTYELQINGKLDRRNIKFAVIH
jgi:Zn-dependent metalloprotease